MYLNSEKENEENKYSKMLRQGNSLENFGRSDDALRVFDQIIDINPKYAPAWRNKAKLLTMLGRHDEAIIAFDHAIEIDPEDDEAWIQKGDIFEELQKFEDALNC